MSTLKIITSEFNKSDTVVSQSTVRRRLKELGYQSRIPSRKPLISEVNRNKRLAFYNLYKSWTLINWKKVIWSDESRFNLHHSDGKTRVWRTREERFHQDCILKTAKWNGEV